MRKDKKLGFETYLKAKKLELETGDQTLLNKIKYVYISHKLRMMDEEKSKEFIINATRIAILLFIFILYILMGRGL